LHVWPSSLRFHILTLCLITASLLLLSRCGSVAAVGSAVVCRLAGLQICLQAAQSMHLHSFFVGCII